jgi:hypothetical protein
VPSVYVAATFVAVEHDGDRRSIRFGLVTFECADGSLCASMRVSSRDGCVGVGEAKKRRREF